MSDQAASQPSPTEAEGEYDGMIDRYWGYKKNAEKWYHNTQSLIVIFGALTPLILLLGGQGALPTWLASILAAVSSSLAAILAAISSVFRWREDYLSFGFAVEALRSERRMYRARAGEDYRDEAKALCHYVTRMEALINSEFSAWRLARRTDNPTGPPDGITPGGQSGSQSRE